MFYDTSVLFLNNESINCLKAAEAVKAMYKWCSEHRHWMNVTKRPISDDPEIVFVDGLNDLMDKLDLKDQWVDLRSYNPIAHFVTKRGGSQHDSMKNLLNHHVFHKILKPIYPSITGFSEPHLLPEDYLYEQPKRSGLESQIGKGERGSWDGATTLGANTAWEQLATNIWNNSYFIVSFENKCYVVERPVFTKANEEGFHNFNELDAVPAIVFRDGSEIFAYEGYEFSKEHMANPQSMTLKDIHEGSHKHIKIDLMGVDNYLKLVKEWKPDVKGKFKKFMGFGEMIVEGDDDIKESWNKKGHGHHHVDSPEIVYIKTATINGEYGLTIYYKTWGVGQMYFFPGYPGDPFDPFEPKAGGYMFNEEDRELWELLQVREAISRGAHKIEVGYQNGKFWVMASGFGDEPSKYPSCHRDIAPAWVKARMFRNETFEYESDVVKLKFEDGKIVDMESNLDTNKVHSSLWHSNTSVPSFSFDWKLEADSWEGLLEKWSNLAFEWLGMEG